MIRNRLERDNKVNSYKLKMTKEVELIEERTPVVF